MAVFKLTDKAGANIQGGATRAQGLAQLDALDREQSLALLEGLKANLRDKNGVPKHGVLKLRNSSRAGSGMEFARMNGMDRWFSRQSAFENTRSALRKLLVNSGLPEQDADRLLGQYNARDRSIKYKHAAALISEATVIIKREAPEAFTGMTPAEALKKAGIVVQNAGAASRATPNTPKHQEGVFGVVKEATDNGHPCMLKALKTPVLIEMDRGRLMRGRQMDANHLAVAKIPGVIAPRRYLIESFNEATQEKHFHVVTAGRGFKAFCRQQTEMGNDLKMLGLSMDRAEGVHLREARCTPDNLRAIAQGFASILMNASAKGAVFGDIKPENAFVDGPKLTLIDTDSTLKHSQWAAKNPADPTLARTFVFPVLAASTGLQQDLWSIGFSLLEASHPGIDLFDIGRLRSPDRRTQREIVDSLHQRVREPQPGSVDEFAMLCITTALRESKAPYTKRFSGEGRHLLDPVLEHPLLGGRDAFIEKNLVKKSPFRPQGAPVTGQPIGNTPPIDADAKATSPQKQGTGTNPHTAVDNTEDLDINLKKLKRLIKRDDSESSEDDS